MDLENIALVKMLQQKMLYDSARQEIISQNIASADIPGYKRADLVKPNFGEMVKTNMLTLETTDQKHISGGNSSGAFAKVETDGPVELDMEALELMKNSNDFAKATTTYKKIISLLNHALGVNNR